MFTLGLIFIDVKIFTAVLVPAFWRWIDNKKKQKEQIDSESKKEKPPVKKQTKR
jgi:hypothetical protein